MEGRERVVEHDGMGVECAEVLEAGRERARAAGERAARAISKMVMFERVEDFDAVSMVDDNECRKL